MKHILKKSMPLLLVAALLALTGVQTSCNSSSKSSTMGAGTMYERHKSNRGTKVKSNIKVKGTNKANSHTTRTRSY